MPRAEPFKVWAERRGHGRRAAADPRQQHVGLPVEQLQHLALEARSPSVMRARCSVSIAAPDAGD